MTSPERWWEVNAPHDGRFTPAYASSAAPPSTEVKQEAIAVAPSGLTRKDGMPSAPLLMPTGAAVEKCICRTTYTCAQNGAGISGQKKAEMDDMLLVGAVDGSKEEITPQSIGSSIVRRNSSRSTGSSPYEKPRSSEEVMSSMVSYFSELLENLQNKWDTRQKVHQEKQNELERKIIQVQQLARECGANEDNPTLWLAVLEILRSECATKFFLWSDPVGRMAIIKHYARAHRCQDAGRSQPHNIRRKSLLKRDKKKHAEDSEEEWDEVFNEFMENNPVGFSNGTGERRLKPSRLPCSSQGKQASSSRPPKRSKKSTCFDML